MKEWKKRCSLCDLSHWFNKKRKRKDFKSFGSFGLVGWKRENNKYIWETMEDGKKNSGAITTASEGEKKERETIVLYSILSIF